MTVREDLPLIHRLAVDDKLPERYSERIHGKYLVLIANSARLSPTIEFGCALRRREFLSLGMLLKTTPGAPRSPHLTSNSTNRSLPGGNFAA
jgi:hypothetical protein